LLEIWFHCFTQIMPLNFFCGNGSHWFSMQSSKGTIANQLTRGNRFIIVWLIHRLWCSPHRSVITIGIYTVLIISKRPWMIHKFGLANYNGDLGSYWGISHWEVEYFREDLSLWKVKLSLTKSFMIRLPKVFVD